MAKDKEKKFEEHLQALEQSVSALEGGELGLEESLVAYEEGVGALKKCHEILDRAEKKVAILLKGDAEEPFENRKAADREKEERGKKGGGDIDF
ncbi:MAG: exodeoxyribonuclease VII small subunit [Candidatus Brocadiae bacterium]|nr:exodeoxyribonuclease VII small subunit [Candidatus Brocadiia bacterium]